MSFEHPVALNSFGADVDKSRLQGLDADIDTLTEMAYC